MNKKPLSLPTQTEVDNFFKEFFYNHITTTFHLLELIEFVKEEFNVSEEDAEIPCELAHGNTSNKITKLEAFCHWGCMHLLHDRYLKRTAPHEYQHSTGPNMEYKGDRLSQKSIQEAMVSVKILKSLQWTPKRIIMELHQWDDAIVESAIHKVFSEAA